MYCIIARKLNQVLTNKLLKFLQDKAKKDTETYLKFYDDYGMFFREGIVTSPDQDTRVMNKSGLFLSFSATMELQNG